MMLMVMTRMMLLTLVMMMMMMMVKSTFHAQEEHFPWSSFARLRAGEPRGARAQSHHREGDAPSNREPMVAGAPGTPCALGSTLTILTLA